MIRTRLAGSALNRFARTQPAEPAPTMTKSYSESNCICPNRPWPRHAAPGASLAQTSRSKTGGMRHLTAPRSRVRSAGRGRRAVVNDAGDGRQVVDDVLSDEERQIERRQADRDNDQEHIQVTGDAVDPLQQLLHREILAWR